MTILKINVNRAKILERLEEIEKQLPKANWEYERFARCTKEHTLAWTKLHNLESEKIMLEGMLDPS